MLHALGKLKVPALHLGRDSPFVEPALDESRRSKRERVRTRCERKIKRPPYRIVPLTASKNA